MAFHDIQFPTDISRHAVGGPRFRTEVSDVYYGTEQRQRRWKNAQWEFDVARGVRQQEAFNRLVDFFNARNGKEHSFRYKDWVDYSVTGGNIGTGDGRELGFQLLRKYTSGSTTYSRIITKPVSGSVTVYVDSVAQTEGVDFTLDYDSGIITFDSGSVPGNALAVTADFQFDVHVNFDIDYLPLTLENLGVGEFSHVKLTEVKHEGYYGAEWCEKHSSITFGHFDRDAMQKTGTTWRSARGCPGRSTGARYLEFLIIGPTDDYHMVGLSKEISGWLDTYAGNVLGGSYGYYGDDNSYYHDTVNSGPGTGPGVFASGDTLAIAVNFATGKIWFGIDSGGSISWDGDPAAGTGPAYSDVDGTYFPICSVYQDGNNVRSQLRESEQLRTPPTGFTPWVED